MDGCGIGQRCGSVRVEVRVVVREGCGALGSKFVMVSSVSELDFR